MTVKWAEDSVSCQLCLVEVDLVDPGLHLVHRTISPLLRTGYYLDNRNEYYHLEVGSIMAPYEWLLIILHDIHSTLVCRQGILCNLTDPTSR
jgi:hypothetical protein